MKLHYLIFLLFTNACTGFKRPPFEKMEVTYSYFPNGNLKFVYKKHNQTGVIDSIIRYDSLGRLNFVAQIRDSVMNGYAWSFDSLGQLSKKVFFINDLQNDSEFRYYPNGRTQDISLWLNGKQVGNAYYYDEKGNLYRYSFFDYDSHYRYFRKYDEDGNIIKEDGRIVPEYGTSPYKTEYSSGDSIELYVLVAQPPKTKRRIEIVEEDHLGKVIKKFRPLAEGTEIKFHVSYNTPGIYNVKLFATLFDLQGNQVNQDSIIMPITVLKK